MEKYNIYSGLSGSFGEASYQYTSLFETITDAEEEAYIRAIEEYESYEGLHGIKEWRDIFEEYCEDHDLEPSTENEDLYNDVINSLYQEEIDNWVEYYAILTEEDNNVDKEDLILDYIEDDSTSQTSSES